MLSIIPHAATRVAYAREEGFNATPCGALCTCICRVQRAVGSAVYFRARIAIREALRASGTPVSGLTALALSPAFLPVAVGAGLALAAVGLLAPLRRSQRLRIVGAGLVISALALVFAVWAAFEPLFRG